MRRKFDCIAVALAGVLCTALPAMAAEDAVVEALIQRGIQLRRSSSDEEALAVFLEAEKQDPTSVRVLLHIVTAAQAAGKWLMADEYMRKVSALSNDEYYRRHADAIDAVRHSIASRVGSFSVQGSPDGATVSLDGHDLGTLPMNEPVSVEAGSYVMEVQKPGYYRLRRNVTVAGGVLTREPVQLNAVPARAAGGLSGPGAEEPSLWTSPALGWSLLGVGVASGVVSGVAFKLREDRAQQWNDEEECITNNGATRGETCGDLKSDADTYQTVGIVTAVAGVVMAGAGTAILLSGREPEAAPGATTAESHPKITGCDVGVLSLACRGSF